MATRTRWATAGGVASTAAFIVSVVTWVIGLTRAAIARGPVPGGIGLVVGVDGGSVGGGWVVPRPAAWVGWRADVDEVGSMFGDRRGPVHRWAGFGYERLTFFGLTETMVCIPTWAPTAVAAAAAVAFRGAGKRLARPMIGVCRRCGYDLRATPDHCPECGATPKDNARPTGG